MIAWFRSEFGFDEEGVLKNGFNAVQEKFNLKEQADGELLLESKENLKQFHVGRFEVPSVSNLRERLRNLDHASSSLPDETEGQRAGQRDADASESRRGDSAEASSGSRRDLLRPAPLRQSPRDLLSFFNISGDARELHLDPANADAVFQVASQFNCLEMVDPKERPEYGITQYCLDHTQGPVCAMSCPAATVFRNYFVPVEHLQSADATNEGRKEWSGQAGGSEKQLDTTCEVADLLNNRANQFWKMENGYLLPAKGAMRKLAERMAEAVPVNEQEMSMQEAIIAKMRVGVHWSTQTAQFRQPGHPSSGRRPISPQSRLNSRKTRAEPEPEPPAHSVCQVLCSAVPVAYDQVTRPEEWEPFACAVLNSQYEATLAVAALLALQRRQRVKLFLTSVGGGAFENKTEWIVKAVERAVEMHKQYPIDVRMVHYMMPGNHPFQNLERRFTGGAIGSPTPRRLPADAGISRARSYRPVT